MQCTVTAKTTKLCKETFDIQVNLWSCLQINQLLQCQRFDFVVVRKYGRHRCNVNLSQAFVVA